MLELTANSLLSYGIAFEAQGPLLIPSEFGHIAYFESPGRIPLGICYFMAIIYILYYKLLLMKAGIGSFIIATSAIGILVTGTRQESLQLLLLDV